jgi:hypothetical protein
MWCQVFFRHDSTEMVLMKKPALIIDMTRAGISVGPIIPWQVAPQQSLPPLHRTIQYTSQKPRRRKI